MRAFNPIDSQILQLSKLSQEFRIEYVNDYYHVAKREVAVVHYFISMSILRGFKRFLKRLNIIINGFDP